MELRQLRYFVTAAETLNFTLAAQKCFVTQGALSQQIKQLENELGVSLFDRQNNSLALTKAGLRFLNDAREILYYVDKAEQDMKCISNELNQEIRVGYSDNEFGTYWLKMLQNFIVNNQDVYMRIVRADHSNLIYQLQHGDLDVILEYPGDILKGATWADQRKVYGVKYNLIAAPGKYEAESGDEVILSKEYPIVVMTNCDYTWGEFQTFFKTQMPDLKKEVTQCKDIDPSLLPYILNGYITAIVPECLMGSVDGLNTYKIHGLKIDTSANMIWDKENRNATIPLFLSNCLDYFSSFSLSER